MHLSTGAVALAVAALVSAPLAARSQTAANLIALRGLAPAAALANSASGKAALAANYAVTGAIQTGTLKQPTLLPLPAQRRQSLKDAFITASNAAQLADGLGTKLGGAYQAKAHYRSFRDFTSISPAVASVIATVDQATAADSNSGKYFFANATTDRNTPVSAEAAAILASAGGVTDVFGTSYGRAAGSAGADRYGNPRPFQTEPSLTLFTGTDFFGKPSSNAAYLRGPTQDQTNSPCFPSRHATTGYAEAVLLAILVPERYQQEITRAAEYGNNRIILGAHYAMDVIGGRTLALHDLAHLLANDPAYVGQARSGTAVIVDFQAAIVAARADLTAALRSGCGGTVAACAARDTGRFAHPAANEAFAAATLTYGLPAVHANTAGAIEDVGTVAPEAGRLLTAAFPYLSLEQADGILTSTEGPGGGFLDDGSAFGLYSRLDLYAAAKQAAALAPAK